MYARKWSNLEHGGIVRKGQRKRRRFIDVKRPLHVVFRSAKARGKRSFLNPRYKRGVEDLARHSAKRFGVKVLDYVNVGNHIHMLVKGRTRKALQAFLRVFPQRLMFLVTGACKGQARGRFFDEIAYSRVVRWGQEIMRLKEYFWKNMLQALGYSAATIAKWRKASRDNPL